jgi:hypothetical protein
MPADEPRRSGGEEPVSDSKSLGALVLPALRGLLDSHSAIRSVVLATPEGFNVCALGVDSAQVSKMASLVSSIKAMADAMMATASIDEAQHASVMTIEGSDNNVLLVTKVNGARTPLLLMVMAHGAVLGITHVLAGAAAKDIARRL